MSKKEIEFRKKLLSAIKKVENDYPTISSPKNIEEVDILTQRLGQIIDLPFELVARADGSGMDWWLQCEYWSKKLNKAVIWDYDFKDSFEDRKEFIDEIIKTIKEITAFEKRISLKK